VAPVDANDADAFDELWHADRNGPGWTGGDGTASAALGDGRLAWLFGDTFIGGVQADGRRSPDWRLIHNALVVQDGACLETVIGGSPSAPDALLRPAEPGTWWWPIAATKAVASDSLELVLMRVVRTGTGDWSWAVIGVDRAVLDLRSWTVTASQPVATDGTILWGAALLPEDGFIYVYGVENKPLGARLYLARTTDASLLGDWDYFAGDQQPWAEEASAAVPLVTSDDVPLAGLTSASVVKEAGGVVLVSQDPNFGTTVRAWHADRPEGPFGPPQAIADVVPPAGVVGAFTYNAHLHPELAADGRQLLSYDVNGGDTMADASLYRPRFLALAWPTSLPDSPVSSRRATPRSVAMP
jgi:hypothetical protein